MVIDLSKFRIRSGAIGDTEVFDGPAVMGWYEGENWIKSQGSLGLGLMAFVGQVSDQGDPVPLMSGQSFVSGLNSLGVGVPAFEDVSEAPTRSADRTISDGDDNSDVGEFPDE